MSPRSIIQHFLTAAIILFVSVTALSAQQLSYNLEKAYELAVEKGDEKGALEYIAKELKAVPNSADALSLRARIHINNDKYGSAITDLSNAIKYYKNKKYGIELFRLYWWRATIYERIEDMVKARADYDTAAKLVLKTKDDEDIQNVLFAQAQFYYGIDDYATSDAIYRQMLKNNDTDQAAMVGLARNMEAREEYKETVAMLDKCEMYDDNYSSIYKMRLQVYEKLGETDKAIDDAIRYLATDNEPYFSVVEDVIKKHTSYAVAKVTEKIRNDSENRRMWMVVRALFYEWQHDWRKVIEQCDAIERDYGYSESNARDRADAYSEIGAPDKAVAEISRIIEKQDEGEGALLYAIRGDYNRLAGNYEDAISDFNEVIEQVPTDGYAYYKKGWCYEFLGNPDEAMKCYNAGIDVDKEYPYIYLMRGELYLARGEKDLADADFNTIIQTDTLAESGSCRQYALMFLGRNEEAIEWMEKIIATDEDRAGGYYDMACLKARMGILDESVAALKKAVELGYMQVTHIEHDDDLDPIREMPEYIELITELKEQLQYEEPSSSSLSGEILTTEVPMLRQPGGTYEVACEINGLPLKLIFDTGASDVTLSSVEANFMLKNGYLKPSDIKGKKYYQIASGEIQAGATLTLREIKVGDASLRNVEASVVQGQRAPLLLGQSVFERFGKLEIDNENQVLKVTYRKEK